MQFDLRIRWLATRQVGYSYNYNYAAALRENMDWHQITLDLKVAGGKDKDSFVGLHVFLKRNQKIKFFLVVEGDIGHHK